MIPAFPDTWFVAALAILFTLDAVTTGYALAHYRRAEERNGAMRWLFERFGFRAVLVVTKVAVLGLAILYVAGVALWIRWALVGLYVFVVGTNIVMLDPDLRRRLR